MEENDGIMEELEKMIEQHHDFGIQALLFAAIDVLYEQAERIDLMEGELDGTLWSPRNWGE